MNAHLQYILKTQSIIISLHGLSIWSIHKVMTFFLGLCVSLSFLYTRKVKIVAHHAYTEKRRTAADMTRVAADKLMYNLIVNLEDGSNQ